MVILGLIIHLVNLSRKDRSLIPLKELNYEKLLGGYQAIIANVSEKTEGATP